MDATDSAPSTKTNFMLKLPTQYVRNVNPQYYSDEVSLGDEVWQPEVYSFAQHLLKRTNYDCVIDVGSGNGAKLAGLDFRGKKVGIDFGANLEAARSRFPDIDWRAADLNEGLNLEELPHNCLVICSDVVEHLPDPISLIRSFKLMMEQGIATTVVISTPDRVRARGAESPGPPANLAHVQEWSFVEFAAFVSSLGLNVTIQGHTRNYSKTATRNTQILVSDVRDFKPKPGAQPKVLAIVPVFNEIDIIGDTLQRLRVQEIDVHVIDNWSDDGSYELLTALAGEDSRITIERFPDAPSSDFMWEGILRRMEEIGFTSEADWILHVDADEFFDGFSSSLGLREAIGVVDQLGYDSIDFTGIELRPTELTTSSNLPNYWEFIRRPGGRNLHRGWKNDGRKSQISDSGGHENKVQRNLFPYNFLLIHYPLRSESQAVKKIFSDRVPRFASEKKTLGWHTQYDSFAPESAFLWDSKDLIPVSWDLQIEFLPEILGRCGVFPD